jgi:hypothetical protein
MKNSTQSGIGMSVRRSVSILMIFAALALVNVAKAAAIKNTLSNNGTSIGGTNSTISEPASNGSQPDVEAPRLEANLHLFAEQARLYCYTDFGVTPMVTWALPGDSCYTQLRFYPFSIVWGIVGY